MNVLFPRYVELLLRYLKPQRNKVLWLAVLLLTSISFQLLNPQILRFFIDTAREGGAQSALTWAVFLFLGVALTQQLTAILAAWLGEHVAWKATNALRTDLFLHCLRLDMPFHHSHTPGEMIERIDGDVSTLANFFSQFVIQIVGNGILLSSILVLVFWEDWRVGIGLLGFVLFALSLMNAIRDRGVPFWAEARQASADAYGFLEERLLGREDLHANGAADYVMRHFYHWVRGQLHAERRACLMSNLVQNTITALFALGTAVAFALGAYQFSAGAMSIGAVYLIFHYTRLLMLPMILVTHQIQDLQKANASIQRVQMLHDLQRTVHDGPGGNVPSGPLGVEFDGVTFGYGSEGETLKNLSFVMKPGRVLGLVGRTGSGKSTLIRLLLRLYDPDQGVIRLNQLDIRKFRLSELRQHIGVVSQQVQVFQATLRDNLTLFDPTTTDERILQVIAVLGLEGWYRSLPTGLDTPLASGGSNLSAGEAQLLALGRVFLKDPGLVILDEASSRQDPVTDARIRYALRKFLHNRTAIIIAHRMATLRDVDDILILADGQIIEHGPRSILATDSTSRFYQLLQTGLEEVLV